MQENVVELSGVKSNPTYTQMMEGARLVREHGVDLIFAVGGGYRQMEEADILEVLKACY